jgi:hypothetical protein
MRNFVAAVVTFPILPLQGEVPRSGVGVKKPEGLRIGRKIGDFSLWQKLLWSFTLTKC